MSLGNITKQSQTAQLVIKIKNDQQVNEREIYAINSGQVSGLMHFDVIKKRSCVKLVYDVSGYTTLRGILKNPLTKDLFAKIIGGILSNIREMNTAYLNSDYVLMDLNRVMINPSTKKVYFIYIPVQSFDTKTDLKAMLMEMISLANYPLHENNSYVREFIGILNEGINFSIFRLEEFIQRISAPIDVEMQSKVICPRCNNVVASGTNYCNQCGAKITIGQKREASMFNPAAGKSSAPQVERQTAVRSAVGSRAYLLRRNTGEKIPVDKTVFMIGKDDRYSDYCIKGNTAVSRQHAEILNYNNHFFVVDKKSTNKTFFNGQEIMPETQIELFSGAILKFANEEFVFFSE